MSDARTDLRIAVSGLRNDKGVVQYCVAPRGTSFPECSGKDAISGSVVIAQGKAAIVVPGLHAGEYAVAVFHDANGNKKLDTFAGIPKEGYGFSRNPGFKPRAPRFNETAIRLPDNARIEIEVRYLF